jgi:hypothetical protein
MSALAAGDLDAYLEHFSPRAGVVVVYAGLTELDPASFAARLEEIRWPASPVEPRIFGGTAITVLRFDGSLDVPGEGPVSGPWRYAETRIRWDGEWLVSQVEVSPLWPLPPAPSEAQESAATTESSGLQVVGAEAAPSPEGAPRRIDDPPPPAEGTSMTQRGQDGATMRAYRVDAPLDIDGVLDEDFYASIAPIDQFVQSVPVEDGEPSERTEIWFGFDDDNVYVGAKIYDSAGPDGWVANEMRRDAAQLRSNDHIGVFFDTFYDRRNALAFSATAIGGFSDFQITNEGNPNLDWNPVWETRSALIDGGWSVEMAIPFRSLRYRPGREQVWGVQVRRSILRNNEWIFLRALPIQVGSTGPGATFRVSMYGTLVGIEAPESSLKLEAKPYGIAGMRTDRLAAEPFWNDEYGDVGLDVKYGITENLTADFTYNTDFAQVEVDERQVNLTRFSISFPEKRDFFLESRGIFDFGAGQSGGPGGFGGGGRGGGVPTLFYSRRVGIQGGSVVPILGGGRVTGKVGSFDVGLVSIQTEEDDNIGAESTNFSAFRLKRDIFGRSAVGLLFESRSRALAGSGSNQAWGADAFFGLSDDLSMLGYYAQTRTEGLDGMDLSYRGQISLDTDLVGAQVNHLVVGGDFNPEMGFVRRRDFRQWNGSFRVSPRPGVSWIRQVSLQTDGNHITNEQSGDWETRELGGQASIEFENSDRFSVGYSYAWETLLEDARISGATIVPGVYEFGQVDARLQLGPQRRIRGSLSFGYGDFFGGTLTSAGLGGGRVEITPQFSFEPSVSFNWFELGSETFDQHLFIGRLTYTLSPRAYVSGLAQYSTGSQTVSGNFRLRWEWAPGSELFLVYTEDRSTDVIDRWSTLNNRGFVVKLTRLLRL